jgi:hypothetical protein
MSFPETKLMVPWVGKLIGQEPNATARAAKKLETHVKMICNDSAQSVYQRCGFRIE